MISNEDLLYQEYFDREFKTIKYQTKCLYCAEKSPEKCDFNHFTKNLFCLKRSKEEIPRCVFCDIVDEKAKSFKIWENNEMMAFLSIFPNTPGTTVLIPKKHLALDFVDLPEGFESILMPAIKTVSQLLKKIPGVSRVAFVYEGFGVKHFHVKLFPLHQTLQETWQPILSPESKKTEFFSAYPGYISSHDGSLASES